MGIGDKRNVFIDTEVKFTESQLEIEGWERKCRVCLELEQQDSLL